MLKIRDMRNPFVTNGYAGPECFCDRIEETKAIVGMLTNQNNLALISPRRIGKTDLIRHCFNQPEIRDNYYTFEVDIYATNSLNDFVNVFGKAVLDALRPKGRKVWDVKMGAEKLFKIGCSNHFLFCFYTMTIKL